MYLSSSVSLSLSLSLSPSFSLLFLAYIVSLKRMDKGTVDKVTRSITHVGSAQPTGRSDLCQLSQLHDSMQSLADILSSSDAAAAAADDKIYGPMDLWMRWLSMIWSQRSWGLYDGTRRNKRTRSIEAYNSRIIDRRTGRLKYQVSM